MKWVKLEFKESMVCYQNESSYKFSLNKNESFWLSKKMVREFKGVLYINIPEIWQIKVYRVMPGQEDFTYLLQANIIISRLKSHAKNELGIL